MALGEHQKNQDGTFRRERADSLIEKLKREYPILSKLHGNIKTLGGAENSLGVDSLSQVLKKLRNK